MPTIIVGFQRHKGLYQIILSLFKLKMPTIIVGFQRHKGLWQIIISLFKLKMPTIIGGFHIWKRTGPVHFITF